MKSAQIGMPKLESKDKMNAKIVFRCLVIITLIMLMPGCFTRSALKNYQSRTADTFNPSAVYQAPNHDGFVLEGIRHNNPEYSQPSLHAFVLIPKERLASVHLQTNQDLSLEQIRRLPPDLTTRLKSKKQLPSNYEKIASLPPNDINFELKVHHPGRAVFMVLPFTVVFDVATSPFQILFFPFTFPNEGI